MILCGNDWLTEKVSSQFRVTTECEGQSIVEASGVLFSVRYRANSEQDRSLYLAVLSLLWKIVTQTVTDKQLWSAALECGIAHKVVTCHRRTVH
jgi:hypothetical protein